MALSTDAVKRLMIATTSAAAGNEIATAINQGLGALIIATNVSSTIDFAALQVGDYVVHVPATAGNAQFTKVVTAGTLPVAAVVGDLYLAFRAPAASALVF